MQFIFMCHAHIFENFNKHSQSLGVNFWCLFQRVLSFLLSFLLFSRYHFCYDSVTGVRQFRKPFSEAKTLNLALESHMNENIVMPQKGRV